MIKIVPKDGERDSQGKKKPKPRKCKDPFHYTPSDLKAAMRFIEDLTEKTENVYNQRIIDDQMTVTQATKKMKTLRTLNRVLQNMTSESYAQVEKSGKSRQDYKGVLF